MMELITILKGFAEYIHDSPFTSPTIIVIALIMLVGIKRFSKGMNSLLGYTLFTILMWQNVGMFAEFMKLVITKTSTILVENMNGISILIVLVVMFVMVLNILVNIVQTALQPKPPVKTMKLGDIILDGAEKSAPKPAAPVAPKGTC